MDTTNKERFNTDKQEVYKNYKKEIDEIVSYLNFKTNKKFTVDSMSTNRSIKRILSKGYTIKDFKDVIDCKSKEWINTKFEKYIRPNTIFGFKFDEYLQESKCNKSYEDTIRKTYEIKGYEELMICLKKMSYTDYLMTEHWLHFRDEALKFFRDSCQVCGCDDNPHIHHKSYANRGRETFNDVICLCNNCHKLFHNK